MQKDQFDQAANIEVLAKKWQDWKWQLRHSIKDIDSFEKLLDIKFEPEERKQLEETLEKFARGELECLVACHRLSEGIDIQSLNTVILFSSDRARLETIQRVGRCLRTDPNNPTKIANVIDFIREDSGTDEDRKVWLEEISRIKPKEEQ